MRPNRLVRSNLPSAAQGTKYASTQVSFDLTPRKEHLMSAKTFPIGGSRQAVYDALRLRSFVMSGWSDKHWTRIDGVKAHIYGAGSMLQLSGPVVDDGPLGEVLERLQLKDCEARTLTQQAKGE
jgi:hypothetical protein